MIQVPSETMDSENKTVQRQPRELQIENNHGRTMLKADRSIKLKTQQRLRPPAELQSKWLHGRQCSYLFRYRRWKCTLRAATNKKVESHARTARPLRYNSSAHRPTVGSTNSANF